MRQHPTSIHTGSRVQAVLSALVYPLWVLLLGVGLLALPAQAQEEEPTPERYEDVTWNSVVLVDFKNGKEDRAMEIIDEQYLAASKKAGTQIPNVINMQTGPWDMMLVWTMEDGPSEMTWETSPEGAKFQKVLREMLGAEKMKEVGTEYSSLISRSTSFVGFSGRHGAPITAQMPE